MAFGALMSERSFDISKGRGVFRARPNGASLPMNGQGHDPRAKPIDPDILGRQIIESNRIEGVEPSGEIDNLLRKPADGPLGELAIPYVPKADLS